MPILITTASPWPARCAYISAAIFTTASGVTNVTYGFSKGDSLATSLVWAGVAGAVAIVFALSWPALIRSVDAGRWSAAVISLVALLLSGAYSVTAALGSAAGGRANATAIETATTDARTKAQAAYDAAKVELETLTAVRPRVVLEAQIEAARADLAKLTPSRSVAEIEALMRNASQRGCQPGSTLQGRLKTTCPTYDVELARAWERQHLSSKIAELSKDADRVEQRHLERRDRAQAAMDKAFGELAAIQPARIANSDAKALTRYLGALGLEVRPDRLNDLLVLLSGGGLSLAIGMALSGPSGPAPVASDGEVAKHPRTAVAATSEPVAARPAVPDAHSVAPVGTRTLAGQVDPDSPAGVVGTLRTVRPATVAADRVLESDVLARLAAAGGVIEGVRRLAEALGRPRSTVSDECRRLAAAGHLTMTRGRHRTVLTLAARRPH